MPTALDTSQVTADKVGMAGGIFSFFLKLIPWVIGIGILGVIIYFVWFWKNDKLKKAFGRRRMELETGAKLSGDKSIKKVYVLSNNGLKLMGKYDGHLIIKDKAYVLLTKNLVMDIIFGRKLLVAPKGALKEINDNKGKGLILIGDGFTYDLKKNMFFLNGKWNGLNVSVSSDLVEKNNLELLENYSNNISRVWDQAIENVDLTLKKKLKTGEDVVDENNQD